MGRKVWATYDVLTAADLNNYLGNQVVTVCTSGTRPSSPPTGMLIYETDTHLLQVFDGSWTVLADPNLPFAAGAKQSGSYTFTNTSYGIGTTGGTYVDCGTSFTAPRSGQVLLTTTGALSNSVAGQSAAISPVIRTGSTVGSGTVVLAADPGSAFSVASTGEIRGSAVYLQQGLTGGVVYNVRLEHAVGGGTGTAQRRSIWVTPA